jgi:hypothetical protein
MDKVINHRNIELKIGDKIKIITDRIEKRLLANVSLGEIVTISGFSDDGKIIYHNNTLALPTNSDIYEKI